MRRRLVLIGLGIATIVATVSHRWWRPQLKAWLTQLLDFFGGGDNLQGLDSLMGIITAIVFGGMAVWVWSGGKPQESPSIQSHEAIDPTRNVRSRTELILLEAVADEVESRLARSLHQAVLISLDKQTQPKQVKYPFAAEVIIGTKSSESLSPGTEILDVFESADITGKLLILGEPGSGKTTTLLDLAQGLIRRVEENPSYPIPVLFNLSSWENPAQKMKDWLAEETDSKYKFQQGVGNQWIKNKRLLPLLDGLDEVKPEHQESCVKAINELLESDCCPRNLVVCSRHKQYENHETLLQLNNAILLHDLTNVQIQDYLRAAHCVELWQELEADAVLLGLVRKPLLLRITVVSDVKLLLEQLRRATSTEARLHLLLDSYVREMLSRKFDSRAYGNQKPPTERQTKQWLIFLAKQLQKESQTEFLIEKMQPSWLSRKHQKYAYRLILGLISGLTIGPLTGMISGLTIGLIGGLMMGLIGGLIIGLTIGMIGGLIVGIIFGLGIGLDNIAPVEAFEFSFNQETGRKVLKSLVFSTTFALIGGLAVGLTFGLTAELITFGLIGGLTVGLFSGLISEIKTDIKTRIRANQGILNSRINTIKLTTFSLFISISIQIFWAQLPSHTPGKSEAHVVIAATMACLVWFNFQTSGGQACIQHFSLRLVLYSNKLIPWNYDHFLEYTKECRLLDPVGGRYQFIHKLLQEHFAEMGEVGSGE